MMYSEWQSLERGRSGLQNALLHPDAHRAPLSLSCCELNARGNRVSKPALHRVHKTFSTLPGPTFPPPPSGFHKEKEFPTHKRSVLSACASSPPSSQFNNTIHEVVAHHRGHRSSTVQLSCGCYPLLRLTYVQSRMAHSH
jgi:hypothetical protein